jgi:hypothetical protein
MTPPAKAGSPLPSTLMASAGACAGKTGTAPGIDARVDALLDQAYGP